MRSPLEWVPSKGSLDFELPRDPVKLSLTVIVLLVGLNPAPAPPNDRWRPATSIVSTYCPPTMIDRGRMVSLMLGRYCTHRMEEALLPMLWEDIMMDDDLPLSLFPSFGTQCGEGKLLAWEASLAR